MIWMRGSLFEKFESSQKVW